MNCKLDFRLSLRMWVPWATATIILSYHQLNHNSSSSPWCTLPPRSLPEISCSPACCFLLHLHSPLAFLSFICSSSCSSVWQLLPWPDTSPPSTCCSTAVAVDVKKLLLQTLQQTYQGFFARDDMHILQPLHTPLQFLLIHRNRQERHPPSSTDVWLCPCFIQHSLAIFFIVTIVFNIKD